jgi:hypothetical protein
MQKSVSADPGTQLKSHVVNCCTPLSILSDSFIVFTLLRCGCFITPQKPVSLCFLVVPAFHSVPRPQINIKANSINWYLYCGFLSQPSCFSSLKSCATLLRLLLRFTLSHSVLCIFFICLLLLFCRPGILTLRATLLVLFPRWVLFGCF